MTLDQLRYFAAAATYQHVGRAAAAVAISPSAVSGAIALLEEELQCQLFRRTGRRIELTREGEKLLKRSQEILGDVENLALQMRKEPEALTGKYRLGASHFLAPRILAPGWSKLLGKHPRLVAEIYSMNTAYAIADILSGRLDLAVCFSPLKHPDLLETPILDGEMIPILRKKHPIFKQPKKAQLRFLAETPAVIHKASVGVDLCETHPIFDRLGFQPRISLYFDSDETAVQSVLKSDTWSFVPDYVANEFRDEIQTLELPSEAGGAPYRISSLIRRERQADRVLTELRETLSK